MNDEAGGMGRWKEVRLGGVDGVGWQLGLVGMVGWAGGRRLSWVGSMGLAVKLGWWVRWVGSNKHSGVNWV